MIEWQKVEDPEENRLALIKRTGIKDAWVRRMPTVNLLGTLTDIDLGYMSGRARILFVGKVYDSQ